VTVHVGKAPNPHVIVHGSGRTVTDLMRGKITLAQARGRGLKLEGDARLLKRLRTKQAAA
jgi:hypothetical protein